MPYQTPKTTIAISPSQKLGIACPDTAMISAMRSIQPLGRSAAAMPSGTATASATRNEMNPSVSVTPTRLPMISVTGRLK